MSITKPKNQDTNINILPDSNTSMKQETKYFLCSNTERSIIQKYKKIWNDMYVTEHRKILEHIPASFFKTADSETKLQNLQFPIQKQIILYLMKENF